MITFYDIPSSLPGNAWSPNTWKTRYSLNFKGLEYKTEWVEYPDIAELYKKLAIPSVEYKSDGSPYYSLPVIYDPSTKTAVAESMYIAKYLDKTYPDAPKLIPEGTEGFHHAFLSALYDGVLSLIWAFILPKVATYLNPKSEEHFIRTKSIMFGKHLQDVVPQGTEREREWKKFQINLSKASAWFESNGGKGPYVMGDRVCFADFVVASHILFFKISWGEESPEWTDIKSWDGGRWDQLVENLTKYEKSN